MWEILRPFLNEIIISVVMGALSGAGVWNEKRKTRDLTKLIDHSEPKNKVFIETAVNMGLQAGLKHLSKHLPK